MALNGALGASVIDFTTGSMLAAEGFVPAERPLGAEISVLTQAAMRAAALSAQGKPQQVDDVVITTTDAYFLLRPTTQSHLLYVCLDRATGNLAVAQRLVREIAADLTAR